MADMRMTQSQIDEPKTEEQVKHIQEQVNLGYLVRTRADEPLIEVRDQKCNTTRRDLAMRSGAHIISTNFPAAGMSNRWGCEYSVQLAKVKVAVCNPGNSTVCESGMDLEPQLVNHTSSRRKWSGKD